MTTHKGWIAVDFDATLAHYTGWIHHTHTGEPIRAMVERVKAWLKEGREVRIFTARISPLDRCCYPDTDFIAIRMSLAANNAPENHVRMYTQAMEAVEAIRLFCAEHIGQVLPVTNVKDTYCYEIWDDRCVQVVPNTGERVGDYERGAE